MFPKLFSKVHSDVIRKNFLIDLLIALKIENTERQLGVCRVTKAIVAVTTSYCHYNTAISLLQYEICTRKGKKAHILAILNILKGGI